MGWLILIAIVLVLLYLLIVYIIIPIVVPIAIIAIIGAGIYGFIKSIQGFSSSFIEHMNPYKTYTDKSPNAPSGVNRNYFFGPGLHQIKETIKDAFSKMTSYHEDLIEKRNKYATYSWGWKKYVINGSVWMMYIVAVSCIFVFGSAWTALFSVAMATVILLGMAGFFVYFTTLWIIDRLILWGKSIQSRCGRCKNKSVVPNFICSACGMEHIRLTPGPYGVLYRKCSCGLRLSTTIFTGRSKLMAKCPKCATELAASDAKQFGIQVIGGVSAGKTTFLAAFWHEYIAMLESKGVKEYEKHPSEAFDQLDEWFSQGISSATTETNANMYSIVHRFSKKSSYQLTLYDIAGESFADIGYEIQQQQFRYCEGFIFIIDPCASPDVASDVISSFTQTFRELTGKHSGELSKIPAVVVISKADLFKKEIGLPKIRATHKSNPTGYAKADGTSNLEDTRNGMCRKFLENRDFVNVVNLLDGEFNNVQYYPTSAIGQEAVYGTAYEPWGVIEPVKWILQNTDSEFREEVFGSE